MVIKQNLKKDFLVVSRILIRDRALSYKAKALAAFLSSLPTDWVIYTKWVSVELGMCMREVQRCLKELCDLGYIEKFQEMDEKTKKFTNGWSVIFLDKEEPNEGAIVRADDAAFVEFEKYEKELEKAEKIETLQMDKDIDAGLKALNQSQSPENLTTNRTTKSRLTVLSRTYIRRDLLDNNKSYLLAKKSKDRFLIFEKAKHKIAVFDFEGKNFSAEERDKIREWLIYKSQKVGKRLTQKSKEYQINKIQRFKEAGVDIISTINKSIEEGWAGLFPVKKALEDRKRQQLLRSKANEMAKEREKLLSYFDTRNEHKTKFW